MLCTHQTGGTKKENLANKKVREKILRVGKTEITVTTIEQGMFHNMTMTGGMIPVNQDAREIYVISEDGLQLISRMYNSVVNLILLFGSPLGFRSHSAPFSLKLQRGWDLGVYRTTI